MGQIRYIIAQGLDANIGYQQAMKYGNVGYGLGQDIEYLISVVITRAIMTPTMDRLPKCRDEENIYCHVPARWGLQQTTLGSGQRQDTGPGILWCVHRWTNNYLQKKI